MEGRVQRLLEEEGEPCLRHLTLLHKGSCYVRPDGLEMLQGLAGIAMLAEMSREGEDCRDQDWRQCHTHS